MYRKLLKKIALGVMTAALCVGAFMPMTANAAEVSASSLAGDWYSDEYDGMRGNGITSDGMLHFKDDGTYADMWGHPKKYHLGADSITVEGEKVSFDFWGGWPEDATINAAKEADSNVQIFTMHGNNSMEYANLTWDADNGFWEWNDTASWIRVKDGDSDSKSRKKSRAEKEAEEAERLKAEEERKALEQASREAVRLEGEAAEQGFVNAAQMQDAKAADMSSGEYYNNAVVDTEGIENAVPVAQGGKLIIDGQETNASATISKVSSVYVDSVRAAKEGTLLNVVDVQFPALGAVVNFYMPGVAAGDSITAVQYVDGTWTDVEVVEVRADHVVLNLKSNGVVAFFKK